MVFIHGDMLNWPVIDYHLTVKTLNMAWSDNICQMCGFVISILLTKFLLTACLAGGKALLLPPNPCAIVTLGLPTRHQVCLFIFMQQKAAFPSCFCNGAVLSSCYVWVCLERLESCKCRDCFRLNLGQMHNLILKPVVYLFSLRTFMTCHSSSRKAQVLIM